jgi:hypothetical protein
MTHPCDTCPNALPGRHCAKHDDRRECAAYRRWDLIEHPPDPSMNCSVEVDGHVLAARRAKEKAK